VKYKIVPYICESISIFHNTHENGVELAIFTNKAMTCFRSVQELGNKHHSA